MSPRISFSNDFVESHHHHHHLKPRSALPPPPSSDFEFSVTGYSMITADELFFQGKLLPFKDCSTRPTTTTTTTLREELLAGDGDDLVEVVSNNKESSTNSSGRWRDLLGLRKTHIGSRKQTKTTVDSTSQVFEKMP
ncbi:uncharacterized protein LOC124916748 [Impatiens glandulifera]|uniref:uncharacterized protein LOC124916748 n=1 Tax=Impatiens glandulifera TaxID=253017 RepID=UPI001FB0895D|nr:uncharacterized protein LOC124916748 [Impatiens glandulifera]